MARVVGYGGDVKVASASIAGIRAWTIDDVINVHDTSGYDTDQPKTFLGGQTEWSGSFEGLKDGAPIAKGTVVALELLESATASQKWSGNCIITGRHGGSSVDGMVMYNYDFQGTAALTAPTT